MKLIVFVSALQNIQCCPYFLTWCLYQQDNIVCQCLPTKLKMTIIKMIDNCFWAVTAVGKVTLSTRLIGNWNMGMFWLLECC